MKNYSIILNNAMQKPFLMLFYVFVFVQKRSGGMNNIKISKLHLVDLAGSERQKDTNTEDVRLKVKFINSFYHVLNLKDDFFLKTFFVSNLKERDFKMDKYLVFALLQGKIYYI